ncbi:MAG: hypothetical protein CFE37_03580 [Alphaproteobacteria bacterium PA4]|nr:MAG: hypothetical protein CFE37_03580 [Alphaproteobacteria bacterium PA4]
MFGQFLGLAALLGSCLMAWRWGGTDERLAAGAFLAATLISNIAAASGFAHVENGVLLVDVVLFFGLLALALRSDRFWPMWAAAFQLVGTMFHFASMAETGKFAFAYFVALAFWSYPVMIALGVGTWLEGRHRPRARQR